MDLAAIIWMRVLECQPEPSRSSRRLLRRVNLGSRHKDNEPNHDLPLPEDGRAVAGHFGRAPIMLLRTTGVRTGKQMTNPVLHVLDGDNLVTVASAGGADKNPSLVQEPDARSLSSRPSGARQDKGKGREGIPHLPAVWQGQLSRETRPIPHDRPFRHHRHLQPGTR
jgi:F420H(2)-dependent quinone reductase